MWHRQVLWRRRLAGGGFRAACLIRAATVRERLGRPVEGRIDLAALAGLDDEAAIERLVQAKGIGLWSAEIYLLFALGRPDVWPADDLAVQVAVQRVKDLPERPLRARMVEIAEPWRPHRSAAARFLWHVYRHPGLPDGAA